MKLNEIDLTEFTIDELKALTERAVQQRKAREKEIIAQRLAALDPVVLKLSAEIAAIRPKIQVEHVKEPREIRWTYYVNGQEISLCLLSDVEAEIHTRGHYHPILADKAVPLFIALIKVYRMAQKEERAFARALKDKREQAE